MAALTSLNDLAYGVSEVLQAAQAGNANGTQIDLRGCHFLSVIVTGTGFTGTVNFEGATTENPTNGDFLPVGMGTLAAGAAVTTATATGSFVLPANLPALTAFRARTSGVSAGSVQVTARKMS